MALSISHTFTIPFEGRSSNSMVLRFPPNFSSTKTRLRRSCSSNIRVAKIVAASWSDKNPYAAASTSDDILGELAAHDDVRIPFSKGSLIGSYSLVVKADGTKAVHAGERLGRGIVTDAITTPVVNTSAHFFEKTADLIALQEKRHLSFVYGRYGNSTTKVFEKKISALEGAESTLAMASGMCAITSLLMALVPAGGHLVTTTDCYRNTRRFIETWLQDKGIRVSVIDPADVGALESILEQNKVSLFFSESPTNPFLRCVDIDLVSELCHKKGALVCIDGTFATPLNQKALALGADLVVHSATKYIGGHNDVLGGCISGPRKLVSKVRNLHYLLGGTLNPGAAYLFIRSMKTLYLRVQQQNSTALRMAETLEEHPKVKRVYYPGLASHPEHELAKRQMTGYGGVVSFEIVGVEEQLQILLIYSKSHIMRPHLVAARALWINLLSCPTGIFPSQKGLSMVFTTT